MCEKVSETCEGLCESKISNRERANRKKQTKRRASKVLMPDKSDGTLSPKGERQLGV